MRATETLSGLNDEEVRKSRAEHGANITEAEHEHRFWNVVKGIVTEPMFVILVGASIVYFVLGSVNEGVVMLVALGLVSGIGIFQENKSKSAIDALQKLTAPRAKVRRNGKTIEILPEELVIGDLIVAEEGTLVAADAEVLEQHDFTINESILTGEALPVTKEIGNSDKIFQGTSVASGACTARVTAIGKQTELGKIGQSLTAIDIPKTPLQLQIKSFVRSMVSVGVVAFIIVWVINYYLSKSILNGLLHGLTIAMSVLPEEIPVAFSTFMALGAYRLYKNKVIVRNPHTVETLGAATVICTDKTGTITENKMELSCIYDFEKDAVLDFTKEPITANRVITYAMWASEIQPFDMMEKALHEAYASTNKDDKRKEYKMANEYPLGGQPPIMTHVFSNQNKDHIIACKGSVEGVLKQCKLDDAAKKKINDLATEFAKKGYRVLAVGKCERSIDDLPKTQFEFEFEFVGLTGFYDPPKKNIVQVLQQFYDAGIHVIMITGDHAETAVTIARQIKLHNSDAVLTGTELMAMSDDDLQEKSEGVNVYARMFPEAKLKVIEALKSRGEVVAMTGDGVNDGPALKAAHIGIAMGMRGSEIAKQVASLILVDDDLVHMTEAVALGRRIYENLKKAIQYIISIHIPIILIVILPLVLSWKFSDFFSPIHVVFLELIMGPTCSIIFENEPIEANSMKKPPRKMSTAFFSLKELTMSIIQGGVITACCLGLGYYFMYTGHNEAEVRTIIYTTLIFSNLFLTLVNRSFHYSIVTTIRYKNGLVPIILLASLTVLGLSIYLPAVRNIFNFNFLSVTHLGMAFVVAGIGVMWVEVYKWGKRWKA